MLVEALAAVLVGALVLWLVLQPLIRPAALRVRAIEPLDPQGNCPHRPQGNRIRP
jgi:hypothetical protein